MTHTTNLINSSLSSEWYTPYDPWIKGVHTVLDGYPDLDPCSNDYAQSWIQAKVFWTLKTEIHPFNRKWGSESKPTSVWLNSPYEGDMPKWGEKALHEYRTGRVKTLIILARGDSKMIYRFMEFSNLWCDPFKRIRFVLPNGTIGNKPIPGYKLFLITDEVDQVLRFKNYFQEYGAICKRLC